MVKRSSILAGAVLTFAVTANATAVSAQTTFEACRVPAVGVIYMINVGDAPADCLDPSHVKFSWTEGGTPPAGQMESVSLDFQSISNAGPSSIASISITAPAPGKVLLTLTGQANLDAGTLLAIGLGTVPNDFDIALTQAQTPPDAGDDNLWIFPFSPMAVVPVEAGTSTFYAVATRPLAGTASVSRVRLIAVYQPS